MIWKSVSNEKVTIENMTEDELQAAISVSQSRTVNLGILLNRYKSLENKVKLFKYLLENKLTLSALVKQFRDKAVSTYGTSAVATDVAGYPFSLSFNQLRRLEGSLLDIKLLHSNDCLHKLPYNVDIAAWKYDFIPNLDPNGFTEKEYWVLSSVSESYSNLTLEQCNLILRVTDYWINSIDNQFSNWLIRSKKLIEEGTKRGLRIDELNDYSRFAGQKIYVMV